MHPHGMRRFKNCHLARMSDGHYCIIRDLGPVKGGKGLKHHEVVVDFTWRALAKFLPSRRPRNAKRNATRGPTLSIPIRSNGDLCKIRDSH
jgi:hypothetical protein